MFFEDEKENLDNLENLDDLDLDFDDEIDDESISWEELLKDDTAPSVDFEQEVKPAVEPVKVQSVKKKPEPKPAPPSVDVEDDIDDLNDFSDEELLKDDDASFDSKKDAFDVFGGKDDSQDTIGDDNVMDDDSQSILNELDSMQVSDDLEEDDDDVMTSSSYAPPKKSGLPVLAGVLFAVALVAASLYFIFLAPKTAKEDVVQNEIQQVQPQTEQVEQKKEASVKLPFENDSQIPVVADKDAKKLKADKKIVLSVESNGRINPFLPTFEEFTNSYYAGIPAQSLMPPEAYGNDPDAQELMKLAVSGILFDNVKPSAIITINDIDYFVQKGDMVDDYRVMDINRQSVVVKKGTNIYKAGVGERFGNNVQINGSAVYNANGTRNYQSAVSDGYTSASDVEVISR